MKSFRKLNIKHPTRAYLCHVGDKEGEPSHEEHAQEDAQRQAGLQRLLAVLAGKPSALAAGRGLAQGAGNLQWEMER